MQPIALIADRLAERHPTPDNWIFAPTATDILEQLPESFYLHKHILDLNGKIFWGCTNGRFAMPEDPFLDSGWHPTATQATSEVFFAIQRQPT